MGEEGIIPETGTSKMCGTLPGGLGVDKGEPLGRVKSQARLACSRGKEELGVGLVSRTELGIAEEGAGQGEERTDFLRRVRGHC